MNDYFFYINSNNVLKPGTSCINIATILRLCLKNYFDLQAVNQVEISLTNLLFYETDFSVCVRVYVCDKERVREKEISPY